MINGKKIQLRMRDPEELSLGNESWSSPDGRAGVGLCCWVIHACKSRYRQHRKPFEVNLLGKKMKWEMRKEIRQIETGLWKCQDNILNMPRVSSDNNQTLDGRFKKLLASGNPGKLRSGTLSGLGNVHTSLSSGMFVWGGNFVFGHFF